MFRKRQMKKNSNNGSLNQLIENICHSFNIINALIEAYVNPESLTLNNSEQNSKTESEI